MNSFSNETSPTPTRRSLSPNWSTTSQLTNPSLLLLLSAQSSQPITLTSADVPQLLVTTLLQHYQFPKIPVQPTIIKPHTIFHTHYTPTIYNLRTSPRLHISPETHPSSIPFLLPVISPAHLFPILFLFSVFRLHFYKSADSHPPLRPNNSSP